MIRTVLALMLAIFAGACASAPGSSESLSPTESSTWLTCPDTITLDLRPDHDRSVAGIRAVSPSAGAEVREDLAAFATLPPLSYELYDVFDADGDLLATLRATGLEPVGLIYGDPGRQTERPTLRRRERDSRTFYGFVADEPDTGRRVIVFRGTLEPNEWLRNLQLRQTRFPAAADEAQVHAGFLSIFQSLTLQMDGRETGFSEALSQLIDDRDTVFVGHSLGAALATLAGVQASLSAPEASERLRVVTFASPRVGDEGFAALAAGVGRIDRVCNVVDAVTAVPGSTRRIVYTHVGALAAVSSFDWPQLDNAIDATPEQVGCWHSARAYAFMTAPGDDLTSLGSCAR